jgi:hypothetical protein
MKKPRKFILYYTIGNTTITDVHEGRIGDWVARLGGDDLDHERLLLEGSVTINKGILTIKPEPDPDPDPEN